VVLPPVSTKSHEEGSVVEALAAPDWGSVSKFSVTVAPGVFREMTPPGAASDGAAVKIICRMRRAAVETASS
jgi:hypothetical protein